MSVYSVARSKDVNGQTKWEHNSYDVTVICDQCEATRYRANVKGPEMYSGTVAGRHLQGYVILNQGWTRTMNGDMRCPQCSSVPSLP